MADGPFKSMAREGTSQSDRMRVLFGPPRMFILDGNVFYTEAHERCEKCGGVIFAGDWPWCSGKSGDHNR